MKVQRILGICAAIAGFFVLTAQSQSWWPVPGPPSVTQPCPGAAAVPTASPTPNPLFVVANSSQSAPALTLTGAQAGDCVVYFLYTNASSITGFSAVGAGGWAEWTFGVAMGGGPPFGFIHTHQVTAADVTGGDSFTPVNQAMPSFACVSAIALRHVFCPTDGFGTIATTATTTVTTNSFTTSVASDVGIDVFGLQLNTNSISAAPSGWTLPAASQKAATASAQGCAIAYNLNVGAAGAITVGNATSTVSGTNDASTLAFGLQPYIAAY